MFRRKWLIWLIPLAALTLIIFIAPTFAPGSDEPGPIAYSPPPLEESKLKKAAVQEDMEATDMLCTKECSAEMRHILAKSGASDSERRRHILTMMKSHPHMEHFVWIRNGKPVSYGQVPETARQTFQKQVMKAKAALARGESFKSNKIENEGHKYMVLAIPDPHRHGDGLIGLVKQDILTEVERLGRRNLRLVPFPSEGRYRTESADPETQSDITVRSGEDNGDASHYYEKEVVVKFRNNPDQSGMETIKKAIDAKHVRRVGYTYIFRSNTMSTKQLTRYFQKHWKPQYVEPHYLYITNSRKLNTVTSQMTPIVPNDALYSDYQWNLPVIETDVGWNVSKGDDEVIVAVLDTGVQTDHPDLVGQLVEGENIVAAEDQPKDDVGHGTHVAGIIAAAVNNGEGVAGMSWYNKIMPIKVLDGSGEGTTYSVAQGIIWATDHGAKVINMSLGNYASAEFLHDALKYAYDHDVVLIAASGNDNTDQPGYPAAYPEVLAVAATDRNGEKAAFSNYGDYIDVAAPGASIASTYTGNQYAALSGTSMACPHVSALAALIRSKNPQLTNEEVMDIIRNTAVDLGEAGKDNYFGYGQINVIGALEAADPGANQSAAAPAVQPIRRPFQLGGEIELWFNRIFNRFGRTTG
ncbi:S8 family peptidase [Paenibacillus tarimensis]